MPADPKPSAWAMERARFVHGEMMEWFTGEAQLRVIAGALDAAREEGREACHADRDHAEADRRAEYAARLGIDTAATWDDILGAAREEGRRAGLEEAARALDVQRTAAGVLESKNLGLSESATCREMARRIRNLTTKESA